MSAMPPEWSASSLLARFAVRGHFYEREAGGALLKLRDRLEIFDKARPWEAVRDGNAGLVAVMMNPGASRPLTEADADGWCDAVPDRTQYQLMRLTLAAAALGAPRIRHIRVINLSDLRTPKSAELFAALPHAPGWHSIFHPTRRAELQRALGDPATPVLRAWGMAKQLRPLAEQALDALRDRPALGLTDDGTAYRHPLPQRADLQQLWVQHMAGQMVNALVQGTTSRSSSERGA